MDIKKQIEELLNKYSTSIELLRRAKGNDLIRVSSACSFDRKLIDELSDLITPQPEHKSIEGNGANELRKEFWKLFVDVGHSPSTPDSPEEWDEQWNDSPSEVWPWIASHLNSRNLLERFFEFITSPHGEFIEMSAEESRKKLDEFIESELKSE